MNETKQDAAPMGLDFEWPESLWGLWSERATWMAKYREGLAVVFLSFEDAFAFRQMKARQFDGTRSGEPFDSFLPRQTTIECLRAATKTRNGMVLFDASGNELQRMYFR